MPEGIPVEFNNRINQVSCAYARAKLHAFFRIALALTIFLLLNLLLTNTVQHSLTRCFVFGISTLIILIIITRQYKHFISPILYKNRIKSYLNIFSLEFDGRNVRQKESHALVKHH